MQKLNCNESGAPRLKCPSCGQEFLVAGNDKPTSAFLNNQFVIESTPSKGKVAKEKEDHQCTSCEDGSNASSYCMNCNEWLCDACVNAHQRVKVTKDHIIQSKSCSQSTQADSPQTENPESKFKPLFCKVHPQEQLKLFCANCEKLTCRDCQLIEHKDHRYQFIDEAATKHREILKKLLQYLQINLGLLKDTISDVEKVSDGLTSQQKDVEKEINNAFNILIDAIKARQEALIKELQTHVGNKQVLLNKQKKDLTQMKIILEHNHDFAEFAVKGGSDVALLYSRKVLGTRLHNLNSLKYRQRPLATLDLKFNLDVEKLCNYFGKVGSIYSQDDIQRKIDNYSSKNTIGHMPPRTIALSSTRFQARPSHNDSQGGISKRPVDPSHGNAQFINLKKQGSLGLSGHQMIRTHISNNSNSRHSSTGSSGQEMIVLTSHHKPSYAVNSDGKIKGYNRYAAHYPGSRENHISSRDDYYSRERSSHSSPKLSHDKQSFQYQAQVNKEKQHHPSLSSPMNEHPSIHWPKVSNEFSLANKSSHSPLEHMRRNIHSMSQMQRKPVESSGIVPRSASARSTGSDGSANSGHQSLDGCIVVKQEGQSPDGGQSFTSIGEKLQQIQASENKHNRSESGFDEGQNEDYCGVCRNGGELLCCDTCPKVYHLHCHVPALNALPSDSWSCYLCNDIGSEVPTSIGTKRKYSDGMTEWETKLCQKLLLNLFVHVDSLPFHHKVSKTQVPDYYKVITRPIDLNTILTKLSPQHFEHYQSLESFIIDIRLLFSNCFVYNSAVSEVCKMGRRLEAFFDKLLRKYIPNENHYPDTEDKLKHARKEESGVF